MSEWWGLPVIVGVDNATRIIHSGDTITIDGERGEVEFLQAIIRS